MANSNLTTDHIRMTESNWTNFFVALLEVFQENISMISAAILQDFRKTAGLCYRDLVYDLCYMCEAWDIFNLLFFLNLDTNKHLVEHDTLQGFLYFSDLVRLFGAYKDTTGSHTHTYTHTRAHTHSHTPFFNLTAAWNNRNSETLLKLLIYTLWTKHTFSTPVDQCSKHNSLNTAAGHCEVKEENTGKLPKKFRQW